MVRTPTSAPNILPALAMGRLEGLDHLCGERDEVADRAAQWCSSFKPCNVWEHWLVDRIAVESLRVERCSLQEMAMRTHLAERAKVLWDADRAVDALELSRGLARAPELTRAKLELSSQGCVWLVERWRLLLTVAEGGTRWDEAQQSLAFDLLGRAAETRGPDSRIGGDATAQADLARGEIGRLEERSTQLLARVEAEARAMAEAGIGPDIDRQLRALRRYEMQCLKRLEWAFAQFKKGRHAYRTEPDFYSPRRPEIVPQPDVAEPDPSPEAGVDRPHRSNPTSPVTPPFDEVAQTRFFAAPVVACGGETGHSGDGRVAEGGWDRRHAASDRPGLA